MARRLRLSVGSLFSVHISRFAARANNLEEARRAINDVNPGVTIRKGGKQVATQCLNFAKNYHEGYKLLDEKTRLKVAEIWEKWASDCDTKIAGFTAEDLKPTLSNFEAVAADHMDDASAKLSIRYICRFLSCGFYGSSQSWAS